MLAGQSGVNGFTPLALDRYYRFVHYMTWQRVPEKRTHTPDQEVFHPDHKFPFKVLNVRYSVGRGPASGEGQLISRDDYLPRAFFVPEWEVLENDEAVLQAMRSPQFDPRQVVLFHRDPGVSLSPGGPDATAQVEITRYSPRSISLKAKVQADGFLVLSEMDYPGWRAYLDGREVPLLRADYLLRAIPLPAGQYQRIEVRYQPQSFTIGLLITLLGVLALLIALTVTRFRTRVSTGPATPLLPTEDPTEQAPRPTEIRKRADWWLRVQIAAILAAGIGLPRSLRPHYATCWANIGHHFTKQGDYDHAEVALRRALELAPDSHLARLGMGSVLLRQGRLQEALEHLHRAVQLDPDSADAHTNLGVALVRVGDFEAGVEHLHRSRELQPDQAGVYYNWGLALVQRGRFAEAAQQLGQALQSAPGDRDRFQEVADLWAAHDQSERSIAVLRQALGRWPESPAFLDALAQQLATGSQKELRDGPEAVRLAQRACHLTGHLDPQMLQTLATAWAETGQLHRAIEVARQARTVAVDTGHTTLVQRLDVLLEELAQRESTSPPPPQNP